MSIICELHKSGCGFFSQYWYLLSLYLVAEKYGAPFFIDDTNWLFKYNRGWRDYFSSMNIYSEHELPQPVYRSVHSYMLDQFTLKDYSRINKEIFQLNKEMENKFSTISLPDEYDAIYIRRGDKMIIEAKCIPVREYVDKLHNKNTKNLFIQTDDYSVVEEVQKLLKESNINIFTLCPNDRHGCFVYYSNIEDGSDLSNENIDYLKSISKPNKQVNEFTPDEMKDHVEELIMAVEILRKSRYLVTDFQSNISRYLYIAHNNSSNILTVRDEEKPDFNIVMKSPGNGFIKMI